MPLMQRNKGKRIERELAKFLTDLGFTASRGAQHRGGAGSPDIECNSLPYVHIECKGVAAMDLGTELLEQALDQAEKDCSCTRKTPVVLWRPPRKSWRLSYRVSINESSKFYAVTVCGPEPIRESLLAIDNDGRTIYGH